MNQQGVEGFTAQINRSGESAIAPPDLSVKVELGTRAYEIVIGEGLLERSGTLIAQVSKAKAAAIVVDENTGPLYANKVSAALGACGIRSAVIGIKPGERSKSFSVYEQVCEAILAARIGRDDLVIALGGGVVGDLAGFAAATVRRGVALVQMPTTLLAQVDSSVGGKTGINSSLGKNLIGTFHQPTLVLADMGALDSLPAREFRAGYAEVVKYALIDRPQFFEWLEAKRAEIFSGGVARAEAIAECCRAKAAIVALDETETGERALLNLGHTFGHALETVTGYDGARLVHGEAVAIGCAMAFRFSTALGLADPEAPRRVEAHLAAAGLPSRLAHVRGGAGSLDALLAAMAQDKKVKDGTPTFILARGIGKSFIQRGIELSRLRDFLAAELRSNG
ncbi:MAG: 3-dehydroquinate synthase [Hyphomicrobiales bacterium]|nr:3-dehydroquinate synthase [Hyphomicrobiales bacterium]